MKKIVLIGAGNVATHLGSALCGAGYDVVQIYSRTKESAMELAGKLSTEYTVSIDDIRCDADMYIVALKDSALQELYIRRAVCLWIFGKDICPIMEFFILCKLLVNSVL